MAETKKTKKIYFGEIRELVKDNPELVAFVDKELDLLNRKSNNSKNNAKTQANNELIETFITELKAIGTKVTISEFQKQSPTIKANSYSNQKVNALFKIMKDNGQLIRIEEKGKAYFELVQED